MNVAREISFADWRDAVDLWQQKDKVCSVVVCCVCGVPMPNSHPEFRTCLFDICEMCVEQERAAAFNHTDDEQMRFDFSF